MENRDFFAHETAVLDEGCHVGKGSKIWHFTHIMPGAQIGENCILGQNVFVGAGVKMGNCVKIQNNVSVFAGVELADEVFIGPSVVFTNVLQPRAFIEQKEAFLSTIVEQGATIGANATVLCGHRIGAYAVLGAGSVLTHDLPAYALAYGNPARVRGRVDKSGKRLG